MPAKSFVLEAGGPQRLNISWRAQFKKVFVSLDGNTIGVVHDKNALLSGQEFLLPDGSMIRVQLINILTESELQVLRNGKPLPGSDSHPQNRLKRAYQATFLMAGIWFGISLLYALFNRDAPWIDMGFSFLLFGFVFLAAGFLIRRKSVPALVLATTVWLVMGILAFAMEDSYSIVRVALRVFYLVLYLVPMYIGFRAIHALKNESE